MPSVWIGFGMPLRSAETRQLPGPGIHAGFDPARGLPWRSRYRTIPLPMSRRHHEGGQRKQALRIPLRTRPGRKRKGRFLVRTLGGTLGDTHPRQLGSTPTRGEACTTKWTIFSPSSAVRVSVHFQTVPRGLVSAIVTLSSRPVSSRSHSCWPWPVVIIPRIRSSSRLPMLEARLAGIVTLPSGRPGGIPITAWRWPQRIRLTCGAGFPPLLSYVRRMAAMPFAKRTKAAKNVFFPSSRY